MVLDSAVMKASYDASLEYLSNVRDRRVFPESCALEALSAFDEALSINGTSSEAVIRQLDTYGSPATVATVGGRYFGFVQGACLPVTLGANWLATSWDQNAALWVMSPVAAKLEEVAARWLLEIFDLPRESAFGFVTGATMANFSGLASARSFLLKRAGWNVKEDGMRNAPRIRVVAGEEVHPSVLKGLSLLGFGLKDIERVPVDGNGCMIASQVPDLDDRTILIAQAGNVNSGGFDPFEEVFEVARAKNAWIHVDAAFGLWARASRSKRDLTTGIELADSWAVDGHKWLNTPHDGAFFICRHGEPAYDAFGLEAPYLVRGDEKDPNESTPEMSRRARGVEFWAALKFLGREGVDKLVTKSCQHAVRFSNALHDEGFEILNDVVLNQVVATIGSDGTIEEIISRIQAEGECWVGPTNWKGRSAMRISVSSWATTNEDVDRSITAIVKAAHSLTN